jgi:hypothetical protein
MSSSSTQSTESSGSIANPKQFCESWESECKAQTRLSRKPTRHPVSPTAKDQTVGLERKELRYSKESLPKRTAVGLSMSSQQLRSGLLFRWGPLFRPILQFRPIHRPPPCERPLRRLLACSCRKLNSVGNGDSSGCEMQFVR